MLEELIEVEESELPALNDPVMDDYASELQREWEAYDKSRKILTEVVWPACDRAFFAIRDDMPFIPSMKFIDNGMLGEAGVRNAIKGARNFVMTATLPTDESYMEPASLNDEDDDGTLEMTKQFMLHKADESDIRDTMQIAYDQLFARGVTAVGIKWQTLREVRKVPKDLEKGMRGIQQIIDESAESVAEQGDDDDSTGPAPQTGKGQSKYWKTVFNGAVLYPIDMYRLWLDPTTDIGGKDREQSFIHLTFKTMSDLKNSKNPDTGELLYDQEALDAVEEWTYSEYYGAHPKECESTKLMGIDPTITEMGKFVAVYMFYRQVRTFDDGSVFLNRYFYVARSRGGMWKIIRVQDATSTYGVKPFYVLNCDPWLNVAYGTGLAEKALSALKAQNIIEAIGLNARVLQLFPPTSYIGGVLKDDRKPKMMPGSNQEIVNRPGIGLDWLKPFPNIQAQNVELGMQEGRYYGDKISSATGFQSAGMSDPTRNITKEKTATEVKSVNAEDMQSSQVIIDRINSKLLEPVLNAMYNLCREHYIDEQKFITSDRQGKPSTQTMPPEVLNRDRKITIVGRKGLASKANAASNLESALKILANPQAGQVVPNLPLILQDIIFKLISNLGVPIKPEYRATPEEIFAKEPAVMQAAVQNALQNPEMRQQIGQMLLQSPEGQQFVQQLQSQQGPPKKPPAQGAA